MKIGDVVKGKRTDTGKYWIFGNVVEGKFGPQLEFKMTPELRSFLNNVADGRKFWLSVQEPYEKKQEKYDETSDTPF